MQIITHPNKILRLPSVQARTGLSRSTIYLRIAEGSFPRQISLGARAIGWLEGDIDAWIDGLVCGHRSPFAHPDNSQISSATASQVSPAMQSRRSCRGRKTTDGRPRT